VVQEDRSATGPGGRPGAGRAVSDRAVAGAPVSPLAARALSRRGMDRLGAHLASHYGVDVRAARALDVGVVHLQVATDEPWVARVFPADRPLEGAGHDAQVLFAMERVGFPAERCAVPEPVSVLDGQAVLVTRFVDGRAGARTPAALRGLGRALGSLHARTARAAGLPEPGGAWHHLAIAGGAPGADVDAALAALDEVEPALADGERSAWRGMRAAVARAEDGAGLPEALLHPDFVPANVVWTADRHMVAVDWTGAGRGPRLPSLGLLLWAAGAVGDRAGAGEAIAAVVEGYRAAVDLEPEEWERLTDAIAARPLLIDAWAAAVGRRTFAAALADARTGRGLAARIAERARVAWQRPQDRG